jgi:hypothetical protein
MVNAGFEDRPVGAGEPAAGRRHGEQPVITSAAAPEAAVRNWRLE